MKALTFLALTSLYSFSTFAGSFSTGELIGKWNKLSVTVCWLDDHPIDKADFAEANFKKMSVLEDSEFFKAPDEIKQKIQDIITREYTTSKTGIHFTGWKSCQETASADVQILVGDKSKSLLGHATLGRLTNDESNDDYSIMGKDNKGYVYLNIKARSNVKITTDESILSTALHEFGHLAGLRHEFNPENTLCKWSKEKLKTQTSRFSVFDSSSIMNNCFLDFVEKEAGLNFYLRTSRLNLLRPQNPPNSKLPIVALQSISQFTDETIVSKTTVDADFQEYKIRLGLSKGDIHGLKCMYVYDSTDFARKCQINSTF